MARSIGMAWYAPEEFAAMTALCVDMRDADHGEWLEHAEAAWERDAARMNLVKIEIKADEFAAWCKAKRKMPLAAARREYVAEAADRHAKAARDAAKAEKAKAAKTGWRSKIGL